MEYEEFSVQSDGTTIYGQCTRPDEVLGVVVLVHGFGEHLGRYRKNIVPLLVHTRVAVLCYDNIGHGKSGGKRGHCPNYQTLLDILDAVISKARTNFPGLPLFLYGHSMGGNLVLNYALQGSPNLKGIMATSPYLKLAFRPPKWKMALGRLMMGIMPSITLPAGLDPKGISRIPEEVRSYSEDPLVHDQVSPMYSFPIMDAGLWAIDNAHRLAVDTLLLHGTGDPIIDHTATVAFHEGSSKTQLELFEGAYHELHHDLCRDKMMKTVQTWLGQHLN